MHNEQRHQWLRQEAYMAHQSAKIENLEMAIETQKRAIKFQTRSNGNRLGKNKHRGWNRGRVTKNRFNNRKENCNMLAPESRQHVLMTTVTRNNNQAKITKTTQNTEGNNRRLKLS
jgi:hypothetical protein